jgi:hypothetical protein
MKRAFFIFCMVYLFEQAIKISNHVKRLRMGQTLKDFLDVAASTATQNTGSIPPVS